ncbi:hypothetical protein C1T31_06270 [Hanstruepera neustonica]|uniref:Carboxypeptidase regulatory-like domain-containing protein n=1 Tax=Hanstruepera neustonica TaxID=1445657 RepID=A0A2K1E0X5_9FLAO|nr:hypothetical protein C1T31_06270 [Hanstruepera neustonica]
MSDTNPNPNPEVFTENFGNDINRDFLGEVVDKNNNPIHNATVTLGDQTTLTDANGIFIIRGANIYERFGYVKVEKAGYIHGSRSVVPTNGTNKVKIMLLEETIVGTTASGTSETINLSNGASVALEGEYIKEDGSAYSGSVNVIMHHLDPTDENMRDQMPGMLYAANAQNEERMLQTFGMLAVELRGSNGEDLNLATGSTAEITVPLDATLLDTAPATIPLWYFDEVSGYWKEEGEATLVGNNYVGTVSHFSFWNCDIPAEAVMLCINVIDEEGNALSNLRVIITSENYGSRYGYTNTDGQVCGLVPSNETLTVTVSQYNDLCTGNLYTNTTGPFTSDSEIDILVESNSNGNEWLTETVTGIFTDCDGNAITDGYVKLFKENDYPLDYDFVDNGNFELTTVRCSNSSNIFKLKAEDYVNIQETDTLSFTYTPPITDVGSIAACNAVDEFITYQVDDGGTVTLFNIQGGLDFDSFLSIYYNDNNSFLSLNINNYGEPIIVNTYSDPNVFFSFRDENYASYPDGINTNIEANISLLGELGEYIDINFNGIFIDFNTNIEHSISGTIHVIRDY